MTTFTPTNEEITLTADASDATVLGNTVNNGTKVRLSNRTSRDSTVSLYRNKPHADRAAYVNSGKLDFDDIKGTGLTLNIGNSNGAYTINSSTGIDTAGSGYQVGDIIKVGFATLGGMTTANDFRARVSTVSSTGGVTGLDQITGTPATPSFTQNGLAPTNDAPSGMNLSITRNSDYSTYTVAYTGGGAYYRVGDSFTGIILGPDSNVTATVSAVSSTGVVTGVTLSNTNEVRQRTTATYNITPTNPSGTNPTGFIPRYFREADGTFSPGGFDNNTRAGATNGGQGSGYLVGDTFNQIRDNNGFFIITVSAVGADNRVTEYTIDTNPPTPEGQRPGSRTLADHLDNAPVLATTRTTPTGLTIRIVRELNGSYTNTLQTAGTNYTVGQTHDSFDLGADTGVTINITGVNSSGGVTAFTLSNTEILTDISLIRSYTRAHAVGGQTGNRSITLATSRTGTGATINVSVADSMATSTVATGGTGYNTGEFIRILGDLLTNADPDGAIGVNDITYRITASGGEITALTQTSPDSALPGMLALQEDEITDVIGIQPATGRVANTYSGIAYTTNGTNANKTIGTLNVTVADIADYSSGANTNGAYITGITEVTKGSNHAVGDVVTILGTALGTGTDNATFKIQEVESNRQELHGSFFMLGHHVDIIDKERYDAIAVSERSEYRVSTVTTPTDTFSYTPANEEVTLIAETTTLDIVDDNLVTTKIANNEIIGSTIHNGTKVRLVNRTSREALVSIYRDTANPTDEPKRNSGKLSFADIIGTGLRFTPDKSGATYTVDNADITAGGTGYQIGDIIEVDGSDFGGTSVDDTNDLYARVSAVDTNGAVTGLDQITGVSGALSERTPSVGANIVPQSGAMINIRATNGGTVIVADTSTSRGGAPGEGYIENQTIPMVNVIDSNNDNNVQFNIRVDTVDDNGGILTATPTRISGFSGNFDGIANSGGLRSRLYQGGGALFMVVNNNGASVTVTPLSTARGSGYPVGNVIRISGSSIGGTDGTHDITFKVATLSASGGIQTITTPTGTPPPVTNTTLATVTGTVIGIQPATRTAGPYNGITYTTNGTHIEKTYGTLNVTVADIPGYTGQYITAITTPTFGTNDAVGDIVTIAGTTIGDGTDATFKIQEVETSTTAPLTLHSSFFMFGDSVEVIEKMQYDVVVVEKSEFKATSITTS